MWSFPHFGSGAGADVRPQHLPADLEHFLYFFPVTNLNSFPLRFSPPQFPHAATKSVGPSPELPGGLEGADCGNPSGCGGLLAPTYVRIDLTKEGNLMWRFGGP
jgi:hypothetical protein